MLILALTDQFPQELPSSRSAPARADRSRGAALGPVRPVLLRRASSASGAPRRSCSAIAMPRRRPPPSGCARRWTCFERAEAIRPAHNDDAVLRWNACARLLQHLPEAQPDVREEPIQLE